MMSKRHEIATFAGGCFWYMVEPFDYHPGIKCVTVGYCGGHTRNPNYQSVCTGITGHTEVVQVIFDPQELSYNVLLELFWQHIDPMDPNGQFVDRGSPYRSVIYYHSEQQRQLAKNSRARLNQSGIFEQPVVTEIEPVQIFYPAEDYHQDFYKKEPEQFEVYYSNSGRSAFMDKYWKLE